MIAKRIDRKKNQPSRYSKLVKYLFSDKSQGEGERVLYHNITNCLTDDVDLSIIEVEATQTLNQMVNMDKTHHLVLSFRSNDQVTPEMMKEIENYFCESLGFGEHQRISIAHGDTAHLHLHVAINKLHPETYKICDPFQDKKRMQEMCREMEKKYGLEPEPNRVEKEHVLSSYGMKSFEDWLKENATKELVKAANEVSSWAALQEVAGRFDVEFRKSGAGLAVSHKSETLFVKASSLSRELAYKKLVEKFGEFDELSRNVEVKASMSYQKTPLAKDSQGLWNTYIAYKEEQKGSRSKVWAEFKAEKAKVLVMLNEKITNKKIMVKVSKNLGFIDKKIERSKIAAEYIYKRNEINKYFAAKSSQISEENKTLSWPDWLHDKALSGDLEAVKSLQKIKKRDPLKKDEALVSGRSGYEPKDYLADVRYDIKRNGDIHYRIGDSVVIDQGRGIRVVNGASKEAIDFAVELAKVRFGGNLKVEGNRELCSEINKKLQRGLER